ncbi:hypothetical protein N9D23_06145 [Rubripirellula sp.]|nr:hypothetical protein [Rubripirellula sp.]
MLHQTNILKHGAVHNKMQASEDMGHARLRHRDRIVELSRKTISDNHSQRIASTHNDTHELQAQATGQLYIGLRTPHVLLLTTLDIFSPSSHIE